MFVSKESCVDYISRWVLSVIDCLALLCVVMANGRFCGQLVNPLFRKLQASDL